MQSASPGSTNTQRVASALSTLLFSPPKTWHWHGKTKTRPSPSVGVGVGVDVGVSRRTGRLVGHVGPTRWKCGYERRSGYGRPARRSAYVRVCVCVWWWGGSLRWALVSATPATATALGAGLMCVENSPLCAGTPGELNRSFRHVPCARQFDSFRIT